MREELIAYAKTLIGTPYKVLDCNEFVKKVYRQVGIKLADPSAGNARSLYKKGLTVEVKPTETPADIKLKLEPCDLLFWTNPKYKRRWRRIHHVSMYIGDGQNIESTPSLHGVGIRNIWETHDWQICLIGKPLGLIKPPQPVYYTVKKGDNLTAISHKYGITIAKILELNPEIYNANIIHPGEKIRVK